MNAELEECAKKEVAQLAFCHKHFNMDDIMAFANLHGYQAALGVMTECVEKNVSKEKRKLQLENEGGLFKQLARNYKGQKKNVQKATEWESHVENVRATGGDGSYEYISNILDGGLDAGNISQSKYNIAKDFLDGLEREKKVRAEMVAHPAAPGRLLRWNPDTLHMECAKCGEPVESMKLHASVSIGLTWVDGNEGEEVFGCDDWEYSHIYIQCVCGVIIKTGDVKSFTGPDFSFADREDFWEVHIPKPVAVAEPKEDDNEREIDSNTPPE